MAMIKSIANSNKEQYPFIENHLPYLKVNQRNLTGAGMYVNFEYLPEGKSLIKSEYGDGILGSNQIAELNTMSNGLGFSLELEKGEIKYLEIFTYGDEAWDGTYNLFTLIDI